MTAVHEVQHYIVWLFNHSRLIMCYVNEIYTAVSYIAELVYATCKAAAETEKGCNTTSVFLQVHKPRYMHNQLDN